MLKFLSCFFAAVEIALVQRFCRISRIVLVGGFAQGFIELELDDEADEIPVWLYIKKENKTNLLNGKCRD